MNLRTLVVNGFKSFIETKIDFPNGITAVVGPNGTGKSNIVDAILWAMGEQSAKSLRSERMEDVIFNGTEQRKPMGMVEASLIFFGCHASRTGTRFSISGGTGANHGCHDHPPSLP